MKKKLLYLSPLSCPDNVRFLTYLPQYGIEAYAIGPERYEQLPKQLKMVLNDYASVDFSKPEEVLAKANDLHFRHGGFDWVESHTEHWLRYEALIREKLGVAGPKIEETETMRRKSRMKEQFEKSGVSIVPGKLVGNPEEAVDFAKKVGYPVILKPDDGTGSVGTYRVEDREKLRVALKEISFPYFVEAFIDGHIETFDGLTDAQGNIVYKNSLRYVCGLMEVMENDLSMFDYCVPKIEQDLETAGRRIVEAYALKGKFFHVEFFRRESDNQLFGLEVNMRPPGGPTIDMWNYADEIDLYKAWGQMLATGECDVIPSKKYFVGFAGRKNSISYLHSEAQILRKYKDCLVDSKPVSGLFKEMLGDNYYLVRAEDRARLFEVVNYIHESAKKCLPSPLSGQTPIANECKNH